MATPATTRHHRTTIRRSPQSCRYDIGHAPQTTVTGHFGRLTALAASPLSVGCQTFHHDCNATLPFAVETDLTVAGLGAPI